MSKKHELSEVLKNSLSAARAEYHARIVELTAKSVENLFAQLEADGWDAQKSYSFPNSSFGNCQSYLMGKESYEFCRKFTKAVNSCRGMHQPEPRVKKTPAEIATIIEAIAAKATVEYFDGWIYKLSGKIGKPVKTATVRGNLWTGSQLDVTTTDGERQVWNTQIILNTSVLGKLFNQFPTRRAKL